MKQLVFDIAPTPQPTLQNFVIGLNDEVVATLHAVLEGAIHERFVYLWGGAGCGKSHLLQGLAAAAQTHHLRASVAPPGQMCGEDEAARCDVILVDNVLALDDANQARLFNIMNHLRDGSGLLIASGPYAPMHLKIRQDVASRLAQGLVFQVKCLSDEDKTQALIAHAQARGFTLPRDVVAHLLKQWKRDLPSLMAVLEALDRYSLEVKRPITVPLAREVLALLPKSTP